MHNSRGKGVAKVLRGATKARRYELVRAYAVCRTEDGHGGLSGPALVPEASGEEEEIQFPPKMHRELANVALSAEGVLEATNAFGQIGRVRSLSIVRIEDETEVPSDERGELVADWLEEIRRINSLVALMDATRAYWREVRRKRDGQLKHRESKQRADAHLAKTRAILQELILSGDLQPEWDERSLPFTYSAICGPDDPEGDAPAVSSIIAVKSGRRRSAAIVAAHSGGSDIERLMERCQGLIVRVVNQNLREHVSPQIDGWPGNQPLLVPRSLIGRAYLDFAADLQSWSAEVYFCPMCGESFDPKRPNQEYCSDRKCSQRLRDARRRGTLPYPGFESPD